MDRFRPPGSYPGNAPPVYDDWLEFGAPGPEPGGFGDPTATQEEIEARRRAAQFGNFMGLNPVVRQAITGLSGTLSPEAALRAIDEASSAQSSLQASNLPGQAQDPRFMDPAAIVAQSPTLRRQGASGPRVVNGINGPMVVDDSVTAGVGMRTSAPRAAAPQQRQQREQSRPTGPALAVSPDGRIYPTAGNYGAYQALQAQTNSHAAGTDLFTDKLEDLVRRQADAGYTVPSGTGIAAIDMIADWQAREREKQKTSEQRAYEEQQRRIQREEQRNDQKRQWDREDKLLQAGVYPRGTSSGSSATKPNYAGENSDAKFQREQAILAQQTEAAARQGWQQATVEPGKPTDVEVEVDGKDLPITIRVPADMPPEQAQAYVIEEAQRLAGVLPEGSAPSGGGGGQFSGRAKASMDEAKAAGFSADDFITAAKQQGNSMSPQVEAAVRAYWQGG